MRKTEKMVLIIGGGPAGMMAAISAASKGSKVTLIEKNESLGKKLLLTGGKRCNLTNICDTEGLISHFSKTGNFLRDAFKTLGSKELISFFTKRGLETRTGDNGRVFPETDKASSVLDVLKKELHELGVKLLFSKEIKRVLISRDAVKGVFFTDCTEIEAEKVVLATGGLSYKTTGSSGEGITIAGKMGHTIVPVRPGLVSLNLAGSFPGALEGLSLDDVKLIFRSGKNKIVSKKGGLIFTGSGISGPITFSCSAKVIDWMNEGKEVSAFIDMAPSSDAKEIDLVLSSEFSVSSGKSIKNYMKGVVPARLGAVMLNIAGINPDKKVDQITSNERKYLAGLFKGLKFNVVKSDSFEKAQVTRGGVSIKDIDPRTMGSKKIKGLYFAGEMIDVDGDCGGFNLQAAFSTGCLAGLSAVAGV